MSTYALLFYEFFQIGLFAVGGGMATLPFLMDLTRHYDWYTMKELTNMIAISQSTPGPVGINMATYAGYNAAGIAGAIVATLALTVPAIVIITIIAKFLENFNDNPIVKAVFYGLRPAVAALIAYAVWNLIQISLLSKDGASFSPDYLSLVMCIIFFVLMMQKKLKKLHPVIWIAIGAVLGILFQM